MRKLGPIQFGLSSLLVVIWVAAALFALVRGPVVWPTLVSLVVLVLIIDHHVSRDVTRLKSTLAVVLMGLLLVALLMAVVFSAIASVSQV